jgi:hypothetical protein
MPAVTLSRTEFEVVWSALELGAVPFPLAARSGDPPVTATRADVLAGLADRGLAVGARLREDLVDSLTALAVPERSVDAVGDAGHPLAALAGSAHGMAALARRIGDAVVLGPIREASLIEAAVALLPSVPAGPGHELAVPVPAVRTFLASDERALTDTGVPARDANLLLRLAEGRSRGGRFGVNVADPLSGDLRRGIPVVSWFDTGEGRYLMTNDGVTLTVAPADAALIAVSLHEVLAGHR